jgi:hypothetical protein
MNSQENVTHSQGEKGDSNPDMTLMLNTSDRDINIAIITMINEVMENKLTINEVVKI